MANVVRTRSSASTPAEPAPEPKKTTKAGPVHTCPRCGFVGEMKAPPAPSAASTTASRYRVVRGGTFMWKSAVCNVQTGDPVRLADYGEAGIANMRGRGIILEPLE